MTNSRTIGVALGALVCAVVVAGNMSRGDRLGMSVYPNPASLALAPAVVFALGRCRRLRGDSPADVREFGVQVGSIAGTVFAIGIGLFTVSRFPSASWTFWLFGSATAFGSVLALSILAAYAAGHKKPNAPRAA